LVYFVGMGVACVRLMWGVHLSVWDRLFATFRARPRDGHERMVIGLSQYQMRQPGSLLWMLALPWRSRGGEYPLWRR